MSRCPRTVRSLLLTVCAGVVSCGWGLAAGAAGITVSTSSSAVVDRTTILSGSPPTVAFEDRVYRGTAGESRVQYEFSLPAIPAGTVVNGVTFNTYLSGWQENNGVAPTVGFYAYNGNGTYQAADAQQLSNLVGTTGQIGSSTPDQFALSTSAVSSGATYLGLNLYAQTTDLYAAFASKGTYPNVPNLAINATVPTSSTVSAKPLFDQLATGSAAGGPFTLTDGGLDVNTQYYPPASVDRRGIMEFNLGLIPAGAKLSGATLQFYVDSMTGGSAGYPQPLIYGYAGNGVADVADASQTGALLATAPAVTGTGLVTINLNAAQLEALLAQGPYLGIMVRGSDNGEQFGFATTEGSVFGPAPTLSFAYATPEPGTILTLLPVAACAALRRRRRGR